MDRQEVRDARVYNSDDEIENHVNNEVDEPPIELTEEWNMYPFSYKDVRLSEDGVQEQLCVKFQKEYSKLKGNMEKESRTLFREQEVDYSQESLMVNSFMSANLWRFIIELMNKGLERKKRRRTNVTEMQLFLRLVFGLSYYEKSFGSIKEDLEHFPLVHDTFFALCVSRFNYLFKSFQLEQSSHNGMEWESRWHFEDPEVAEFERLISVHNASLIVFENMDVVIDDDKMRMRSEKCSDQGWERSKGCSSFGPVNTIICSTLTVLNLCHHINRFGD